MTFTPFTSAQLPTMPWKNRGGITREIACQPTGSNLQDFHWRLSIAEIAASGPFSAFAGMDRVITLLAGDGVRLHSRAAGVDHLLQQALQPFAFSGDVPLDCDVLGHACQDFNVMVRRSFGSAQVTREHQPWALPAHGALLVHRGQWRVTFTDGSAQVFTAGENDDHDGAYWSDLADTASAVPLTGDAQLLAVHITPHAAV